MITNLVQRLPKSGPIVSSVQLSEPKQCVLLGPLPSNAFFNPMAGDCKVTICVQSLPRIARQAHLPVTAGL